MLLQLKNKITGWIAYVVVGIIVVPFALWGINFYFQGGEDPLLAKVGDEELTVNQYRYAYLKKKQELEQDGRQLPNTEQFRDYIMSGLLRERFIRSEMERYRYQVPENLIALAIANNEAFHTPEGMFDNDLFYTRLRENNLTVAQFKQNVQQNLLDNQLRAIVSESTFIMDEENDFFKNLLAQERDVRYLILRADDLIPTEDVFDQDLQKHYDLNKENYYRTEFQFKVNYIEVNAQDIQEEIGQDITEEDVFAFYEQNLRNFVYPEQRSVAYIWIDNQVRKEKEAQTISEEIYDKLQAGEDFSQLVETYSDNHFAEDDENVLSELQEADLEEPFRSTIFGLEKDAFSAPVETEEGIYLFKLLSVLPQETKPFLEIKDEVLDQIKFGRVEEIYFAKLAEVEELIYESSDLQEVAEKSGLKFHQTDWQTQRSFSLLQNEVFAQEFYSHGVFYSGQVSKIVTINPKHAIVFRIADRIEPVIKDFEEVKEEIKARVLRWRTRARAEKIARYYARQLTEDKTTLDKIATETQSELRTPGFIHRKQEDIFQGILRVAYRVIEPKQGKANYISGRINERGDQVVVELLAVRGNAERKAQIPDLDLQFQAQGEYNLILETLVETIEHRVVHDRLIEATDKLAGT